MLRNLILIGVVAGVSALVPMLYENNPQALRALLGGGRAAQPAEETPPQAVAMQPQAQRVEVLSGRKVRISADERGHFRDDFRLNGRTVPAMVDTGATLVAINRSTARRIGISLTASDFTGWVETANGRVGAARATIERLAIGRIELRDVPAVVLDDRALSGTLIGMSFLSRLRRFHVEDGALALEQ